MRKTCAQEQEYRLRGRPSFSCQPPCVAQASAHRACGRGGVGTLRACNTLSPPPAIQSAGTRAYSAQVLLQCGRPGRQEDRVGLYHLPYDRVAGNSGLEILPCDGPARASLARPWPALDAGLKHLMLGRPTTAKISAAAARAAAGYAAVLPATAAARRKCKMKSQIIRAGVRCTGFRARAQVIFLDSGRPIASLLFTPPAYKCQVCRRPCLSRAPAAPASACAHAPGARPRRQAPPPLTCRPWRRC
jgi:hypothetical protein